MFQAVIFDLDGTLIDSMSIWRQVDQEFLGKRGIPVPDDLFAHLPKGNSYNQTALYFKERFALPDSVEDIMREWTEAVRWHYQHDMKLKDGVRDVINSLYNLQIPLAIGTSNHDDLVNVVLELHQLKQYFPIVVTGTDDMLGKPFPDIFLKVARQLQTEPAGCIVIEDTLNGIRAAKAAGMYAIAIYDHDADAERENIKAEADYYAESYEQVWLELKLLLER